MRKNQKEFIQELETAWYTMPEIEKLLQWLNDVEKKNLLTPEEVCKHLLAKQKIYA